MDEDTVFHDIKSLSFKVYSSYDIKKLSAVEITNLEILDCLDNPAVGGLYDLRMGPNEKDDICQTCGLSYAFCAGHTGHITLPVTVYSPVFIKDLHKLLNGICFSCHRLLAPPIELRRTLYQLQALDYGLLTTVQALADVAKDQSEIEPSVENPDSILSNMEKIFNAGMKEVSAGDNPPTVKSMVEQRKKVVYGFIKGHVMKTSKMCHHCKSPKRKLSYYNQRMIYKDGKESAISAASVTGVYAAEDASMQSEIFQKTLTAEEAKKHLSLVWENEKVFLQNLYKVLANCYGESETSLVDLFLIDVILVPPSRFRRLNVLKGKKYADAQSLTLLEILKDTHLMNKMLRKFAHLDLSASDQDIINKLPGKSDSEKYGNLYNQLQRHVSEVFDSDINKERNKISNGIKQIMEKKEGIFRMNMMGKRVNFAARSVISPDPYIMVNEIGIPMVFAKKLTFPEPVNHQNSEILRRAVMNGPNIHPGANYVEMEDGKKIRLFEKDSNRNAGIAKTLLTPTPNAPLGSVKIVHRHLRNGDMVLLNRQPTLHKPSVMAHKARVLPGEKTLRLHYSNCKSYNADFDGDEMNCHFPQSYQGQAECRNIASVNHQYLVPKDGTPLGGLIQDHIIAGVRLTMRGRFFGRDHYQQLVYSAIPFVRKRLKVLPPAILKPERLWSGKQVVSTLLINLIPEGKLPPTMEGKAKVSSKNWQKAPVREWLAGGSPLSGDSMTESEVVVRSGELLCGVIDKAQMGPTPYSLIHICYELYGGEVSSTILTALARLSTHFLQYYAGFSLGIEDIEVVKKANRKRRRFLRTAAKKGLEATAQALDVDNPKNPDPSELLSKYKEAHFNRDDFGLKMLDMEMKKVTNSLNNDINKVCIPSGLVKKFPENSLQLMVESGAKGSSVNCMQISCLLGQIELEGRRMPMMLNGSTLPSFQPYDTSPQAGGFVGGRFLTGINPQEYFFHCMAGREGLIDTAVKTSRSGYLQRCLIKHLEGLTVNYDLTVRDSDGSVIQFLYGEDGLDPNKMQMLKEKRLHLIANNYKSAINEREVELLKNRLDVNISKEKRKIKKWRKKHPEGPTSRLSSIPEIPFKPTSMAMKDRISKLVKCKSELDESEKKRYKRKIEKCPDPVNSKHRSDLVFSSVTEKIDSLISDYVSANPHRLLWDLEPSGVRKSNQISSEDFKDLCHYRYMRSLAEPGENVGLLAAQSIGEPSTQMTLNTFHFAGKGEMNVTLGIPRIREILMTASANIATPTMDLPLLNVPGIEQKAERLKQKLSPVALKDLLVSVKIKESISISRTVMNSRNYVIRMNFLKYSEYKGHVNTTPAKNLRYIEYTFIKKLIDALKKKMKASVTAKSLDVVKESHSTFSKYEPTNEDEDSPPPAVDTTKEVDDAESSAESEDEGDTTSAKSKAQHKQELEYDDPEKEELIEDSGNESGGEETVIKQEVKSEDESPEAFYEPQQSFKKHKIITEEDKALRINSVKGSHSWVSNYNFDSITEQWCEISLQLQLDSTTIDIKTLLEEEIGSANVYSLPQIKEAILVKNTGGNGMMIKTKGVNFLEIFNYVDVLDINKVYSNNIHEIAKIYGIEAAAKTIRKETVNVFAAYGIEVDPRHLSLISDYMTSTGQFRPCNRTGIEGNASPLQQVTFETAKNFLVDSMVLGVKDHAQSPSSNIIMGQLCRGGTGSFGLRSDHRRFGTDIICCD